MVREWDSYVLMGSIGPDSDKSKLRSSHYIIEVRVTGIEIKSYESRYELCHSHGH